MPRWVRAALRMGVPQCTDDDGEGEDETNEDGNSSCRHLSASSVGENLETGKRVHCLKILRDCFFSQMTA